VGAGEHGSSLSLVVVEPNAVSIILTHHHSSSSFIIITRPHSSSLILTHHHPSSPIITHHHSSSLILTHHHPSSLILTPTSTSFISFYCIFVVRCLLLACADFFLPSPPSWVRK
jgi:hypothetical protein